MKIAFHDGRADHVESGTLIVGQFAGERPLRGAVGEIDWRLHGWLSRLLIEGRLDGEYNSCVLIPANRMNVSRILILGLGDPEELGSRRLAELADTVRAKIEGLKEDRLAVALPARDHSDEEEQATWNRALHRAFVTPLMSTSLEELTVMAEQDVIAQLKDWTPES